MQEGAVLTDEQLRGEVSSNCPPPSRVAWVPTRRITIYVAGSAETAEKICREYCDRVGLCVTVTATNYVYTGGSERGVAVGLINYGRFPSTDQELWAKALELATELVRRLEQTSCSVVGDVETVWLSWRAEDADG